MAARRFTLVSGNPHLTVCPEGATQTFKAGDLVVMSSGKAVIVNATGAGASGITGVADKDATGTTSSDIPVMVVTPQQVWRAFPNTTKKPTTAFSLGEDYKIKQTAAAAGEVSSATGADAIVVGFKTENTTGTVAGDSVLIRFDGDACKGILG